VIVDTHCHAYWEGLGDREAEVRANMLAAGVARSVQIGADLDSSRMALALADRWGDGTWCTVGVHPTDCQDLAAETAGAVVRELESLASSRRDKVVGIGETGLDYYHLTKGAEGAQKETQRVFFAAQAALAQKLGMPLVVHTRDAAEDTAALIKGSGVRRAVIHCFSQDIRFARELQDWSDGVYFSFSGVLTYKSAAAVQEVARALPLDRILVETDAPFLVPQAVRGTASVNEPAFTRHVIDFLKALRPEPPETVESAVWENSHRFFGLPLPR
jgi:TatD DNase family protein